MSDPTKKKAARKKAPKKKAPKKKAPKKKAPKKKAAARPAPDSPAEEAPAGEDGADFQVDRAEGMADRVELRELADVHPDPRNPRKHSEAQVRAIARSIHALGFNAPILVDGSGVVVAGHGRLLAAGLLGLDRVPVVPLEHLSEEQRRAYLIADNRIAEQSEWNVDLLREELEAIHNFEGMDLEVTGFDAEDLGELEDATKPKPARRMTVVEPGPAPEKPLTEEGDLWLLGNHRLLCADSTKPENVEKVLEGKLADLVLTDPPYAIFGSSTGVDSEVADDRMVRPFFESVIRGASKAVRNYGHVYVFCDWRSWATWVAVSRDTGLTIKNMLVWLKGSCLGSMYGNGHELVGFWSRDAQRATTFSKKAAGIRQVFRSNVLSEFTSTKRDETGSTARLHNAQKPIALLEELIARSSDEGELVLDLFAGSGSTLIAAERTGRACATIDASPKWCDVVLDRWQRMTGGKPELRTAKGASWSLAKVKKARRSSG